VTQEAEERELLHALIGLVEMGYLDVVECEDVDEIRLVPTPKGKMLAAGEGD
jgi:hypothetical protein